MTDGPEGPRRRPRDTAEATRQDKPRPSQPKLSADIDFGPRYRVIGAVGKGGMGEVYRAYDTILKGDVALKVVRGGGDDDAEARFHREIALARKVTDAHVLRVYDLAEHNGVKFLSMEYVDGEDLAALIRREKRLPMERARSIFRQVCIGLVAAHEQGVIHRDLKPQNVLVTKDGSVRVADFGLARSIGDSGMTVSGAILGSPAYMSPEQVKGEPVDARSDIYSLGILLYQLASGAPPFQADTPHAVMEMRLHKPPRPLREIAPEVPAYIAAIVDRCLAVDPAQRYASVRELLVDLDAERAIQTATTAPTPRPARARWWLLALGAVIIVAGAVAIWMATRRHDTPRPPAAVLPARPSAPTSQQIAVVVLGITNSTAEQTLGAADLVVEFALRRSRHLDPISGENLRQVASQLGKDSALDDSLGPPLAAECDCRVVIVHLAAAAKPPGFTLTLDAVDGTTGTRVFSHSLDAASLAQIVPTLTALSTSLREALGESVPPAEREQSPLSPSIEADFEYSVARRFAQTDNDPPAISHARTALQIDPQFTQVRAALAGFYSDIGDITNARKEGDTVLQSIDRMTERDQLLFKGHFYTDATGELDRAITAYRELLAVWPRDHSALTNLGLAYATRRDAKHALEIGQADVRVHPHDPYSRSSLVMYLMLAGKLDEAVAEGQRVEAEFSHPLYFVFEVELMANELLGKPDAAAASLHSLAATEPWAADMMLGDEELAHGQLKAAVASLEPAVARATADKVEQHVSALQTLLAEARLRLGDKRGALAAAAVPHPKPDHAWVAATVELAAGDERAALATATALSATRGTSAQAYAKIIQAEIEAAHGRIDRALALLREAEDLVDLPEAHISAVRVLVDAKRFADAKVEIDHCFARLSEVAAGDDLPDLRAVPRLYLDRAIVLDALGDHAAARRDYQVVIDWEPHGDRDALLDAARAGVK